MKNNGLRTLVIAGGLVISGLMLQSTVRAQGCGDSTPVVVANTRANPVSGGRGVAVNNSPAAKIDPTANQIQNRANGTTLLLSENGVEVAGGSRREWRLDVRGYAKIKICSLSGLVAGDGFTVYVTDRPSFDPGDTSYAGVLLGISLLEVNFLCRVIEMLPDSDVYVVADNSYASESRRGNIRVWAQ